VHRELRRSVRPLVAFGTMSLLFILWWLVPPLVAGHRPSAYGPILLMVGCFAIAASIPYSRKVTITEHGITIRTWGLFEKSIHFDEIAHSAVWFLTKRDSPVSMVIYGRESGSVLGRLGLNSLKLEDAIWVSSLPQLKPRVYSGFGKLRV
jgi:hypothetical protein